MAIELTPEQQQRIEAIVGSGAYPTVREALDAALAAVELAATSGFEGPDQELEDLLRRGLASRELSEDDFWSSVDRETDALLAAYQPSLRA